MKIRVARRPAARASLSPLLFFLLLLGTAQVASADSGAQISGEMSVSRFTVSGETTPSQAKAADGMLRLIPDPKGAVDLVVSSATMDVRWQTLRQDAAGSPLDSGNNLVEVAGSREHGRREFSDATLTVAETRDGGQVWLQGPVSISTGDGGILDGRASSGDPWKLGGSRDDEISTGDGSDISWTHNIRRGTPILSAEGFAEVTAVGNVTLSFWQTKITISNSSETVDINSGTWTSENSPSPAHETGVIHEEWAQLVSVTAPGATLTLRTAQAAWHLASDSIVCRTVGDFEAGRASGNVDADTSSIEFANEPVEVDGDIRVEASAASKDNRRLALVIDGVAKSVVAPRSHSMDLAASDTVQVAPVPWLERISYGVVALILAGVAVAAWRAYHRSRLSSEAHQVLAERALIEGRPHAARRHARWFQRKGSTAVVADAVFLQTASLMQSGRYRAVARKLSRVFESMPETSKPTFSFLLAVAFERLGQREAARKWVERAGDDPAFRQRIANDAGLAPLLPRIVKATSSNSIAYA